MGPGGVGGRALPPPGRDSPVFRTRRCVPTRGAGGRARLSCVSLALAAACPREAVLVRVVAALALLARQQLLERGERAGGAAGRVDAVARVVRAERVVEVLHLTHAEPVAEADVFLLEGRHRKEEALAAGWVEVDVAELVELVAARLFTTAARVKTVFSAGRVERVAARVFALQLPVKSVVPGGTAGGRDGLAVVVSRGGVPPTRYYSAQDEGAGRHANHADVPHHLGRDLVVRHARLEVASEQLHGRLADSTRRCGACVASAAPKTYPYISTIHMNWRRRPFPTSPPVANLCG